MIKQLHRRKYRAFILLVLGAIAFSLTIIFSPVANAKLFDGPVDKLPVEQRVALRKGEVILQGEKGEYTCRILVTSSLENAWQVLTDYENFDEFLPGVESSQLIERQGDRTVFQQINKIKTFVFIIESSIKIANTETYLQQIAFEAIAGDIENLKGKWILEPVSPYPSAPPDKVLLTHKVAVEPAPSLSDDIFYKIYENRLEETVAAIKQETEKRFGQISVDSK
ncbi:cyclase/dehydrase [Waterburya agarophytonicola K14]|uniref:Cyclase/dehydrase n=1 Tax=Waterburya agarophytonicola KI4 TaxID=2874699 RepID=A0A964BSZ6_9CYAN|nr:SRPBCC family protein [Waterburya agarophytonicola]MCC0178920.1 cyclase/dehydrase [Waterburya agarophytonicola KI4]